MTAYLLNSAVITAPGDYRYVVLPPAGPNVASARDWARAWYLDQEFSPVSTIGYAQTAEALADLLGVPVVVDRRTITMEPGDEALVFRLVFPPGSPRIDPGDKGRLSAALVAGHYELGLLTRLA